MFSNSCFSYPYYVKIIFHKIQNRLKIFVMRTCIYMEQGQIFIFTAYFNIMHSVLIIIFRRNILRIIMIGLNWFTQTSKFGLGFNNNELFLACFSSFHCIILILLSVLVQQARKFLSLAMELKGKIVLQHSMQYQGSLQFWRYL